MLRLVVSASALVGVLTLAAHNPTRGADAPRAKGRRQVETLDYRGVTLDDGHPKLMLDEAKAYYLRIPNDDLLKGFRKRAGHPAPGRDLGGWYSSDTFQVFGQIVSGLARLHAASGDPACRRKVDVLLAEWAKCIASDGYFYASPKPNAPHYIYDKMVGGLVDAYLFCDNRDALKSLSRITAWAERNLERSRRTADTSTEWYTLSENLYRAYLATGDARYRDFAERCGGDGRDQRGVWRTCLCNPGELDEVDAWAFAGRGGGTRVCDCRHESDPGRRAAHHASQRPGSRMRPRLRCGPRTRRSPTGCNVELVCIWGNQRSSDREARSG